MRATRLLEYALTKKPETVLDLAVGPGEHAKCFIANGAKVTGVDVINPKFEHPDYTHIKQAYEFLKLEEQFDMVWSCHTLEHIPNPQHFLTHLWEWLKEDGWLAIAVPPLGHDRMHIGHMTIWSIGHLVYNLICAGWDCREAKWYTDYRSIGLIVQKTDPIDYSGRTGMPSETYWLNQFTPIIVNHEDSAYWPDNWHEETDPPAKDPPMVTVGYQLCNKPPRELRPFGPNPNLRKEPGTWRFPNGSNSKSTDYK